MGFIQFRIPDNLKKRFELRVGKGNMSQHLLSHIEYIAGGEETIDEHLLRKEFEMKSKQKEILDSEWGEMKSKLDSIAQAKEVAEIERLKKEKEMKERLANMKYESVKAHLSEMIEK